MEQTAGTAAGAPRAARPAPSGTSSASSASRASSGVRPATVSDIAAQADRVLAAAGVADPLEDEPIDLLDVVELLRAELGALRLPLEVPAAALGRGEREALIAQLDDYLLPRLRRMDAPVLAVVGGSTGAGKSTLVNSLVRKEVTRSGVLRPTTRSPVLVHHPYDSGAFLSQRILPGLARVTLEAPEPAKPIDVDAAPVTALRLVPHDGMPSGVAIIDAPDIDSLVEANRELAVQLLAAADLWLFVTTAARYADAVPWDMLRSAVARGVSVAVVLDRVPPEAMTTVRTHLATMLRDRGLATSPMFTIPETTRSPEGFIPADLVAPLMGWLTRLARDARSRDVVIRRTLVGALDSLRDRIPVVAAAADEQVSADERLRDALDEVYAVATDQLEQRLCDGTLLRGEVLARWQEFVGTGDLFRSLEATVSSLRERLGAGARGGSGPITQLEAALRTGLAALIRSAAQTAADEAVAHWRDHPEGAALLDAAGPAAVDGDRLDTDLDLRLTRTIEDWQAQLVELVRNEVTREVPGRSTQLNVAGAGAVLALAVFSFGAGQTGTPGGVVAGTAAVAQRVLEAVLGDQAVRGLVATARADLLTRAGAVLDGERSRIEALLDDAGVRDGRGETLRAIAGAVEEAR